MYIHILSQLYYHALRRALAPAAPVPEGGLLGCPALQLGPCNNHSNNEMLMYKYARQCYSIVYEIIIV